LTPSVARLLPFGIGLFFVSATLGIALTMQRFPTLARGFLGGQALAPASAATFPFGDAPPEVRTTFSAPVSDALPNVS
jgi:hypothetical protein